MGVLSVPVLLVILGGLCLLAALFGGITGNISLPTLGKMGRAIAGILAPILLISGIYSWIWIESRNKTSDVSQTTNAPTPTSDTAGSTTDPTTTTTKEETIFKFDKPGANEEVTGVFTVRGTAPDMGNDSLWLFNLSDTADSPELVYYRTSDKPIPITDGQWRTQDGPVGAPDEIGLEFILAAVRANPACSAEIGTAPANEDGDVVLGPKLPAGCSELGRVTVIKRG